MVAIIALVIFLLYAFAGLVAFIPYILGIIFSFFNYFLDLIRYNIYPVGDYVYTILIGLIVFFIFWFIFQATTKHSS